MRAVLFGHDESVTLRRYLPLLALLLVGCLPVPRVELDLNLPPPTFWVAAADIETEYVNIAGFPDPNTPARFNRALYLRYFSSQNTHLDTILILMPGIFGGATSLDLLARELTASLPNTEVWAVDRRANLLEDRSQMRAAIRQQNGELAWRYYVQNVGTSEGFTRRDPNGLGFMRRWTLELHLEDLHRIVLRANERAERVVLGGHSLGASMASYYAAYRVAEGAGQDYLDGLLLIDGALGRTGGYDRAPIGLNLGPLELLPGTESLEAGRGEPYLAAGLGPRFHAGREALALLARFAPEAPAPAGLFSFPLTNRAALGISEDDSYAVATVFSSSVGQTVDAELGGNLGAVLLGGVMGLGSRGVVGVAEGASFVDWERGDSASDVSDIMDVAVSWATLETNRSEWYFPLRLALDIGEHEITLQNEVNYIPNAEVSLPTLAIGAARGLAPSLDDFAAYNNARVGSPFTAYVLPSHTHLDIVQAENNPLVSLTGLWLRQFR